MPGTATNLDTTRIHQGPGNLWLIGGGVTDSATPQLTIATDGTPDATAHPSSIHLGATESAITFAVIAKLADIKIDQADGPVARYLDSLELSLEAEMAQLDPAIIQQCMPYATYSTAGGYRQLTFGGLLTLSTLCIALISQKREVPGKYLVSVIFKAQGTMGLSTAIGRAKVAGYKAQFKGLSDLTRTAGRQIGVFYETI